MRWERLIQKGEKMLHTVNMTPSGTIFEGRSVLTKGCCLQTQLHRDGIVTYYFVHFSPNNFWFIHFTQAHYILWIFGQQVGLTSFKKYKLPVENDTQISARSSHTTPIPAVRSGKKLEALQNTEGEKTELHSLRWSGRTKKVTTPSLTMNILLM